MEYRRGTKRANILLQVKQRCMRSTEGIFQKISSKMLWGRDAKGTINERSFVRIDILSNTEAVGVDLSKRVPILQAMTIIGYVLPRTNKMIQTEKSQTNSTVLDLLLDDKFCGVHYFCTRGGKM